MFHSTKGTNLHLQEMRKKIIQENRTFIEKPNEAVFLLSKHTVVLLPMIVRYCCITEFGTEAWRLGGLSLYFLQQHEVLGIRKLPAKTRDLN